MNDKENKDYNPEELWACLYLLFAVMGIDIKEK